MLFWCFEAFRGNFRKTSLWGIKSDYLRKGNELLRKLFFLKFEKEKILRKILI